MGMNTLESVTKIAQRIMREIYPGQRGQIFAHCFSRLKGKLVHLHRLPPLPVWFTLPRYRPTLRLLHMMMLDDELFKTF